MNHIEYAEKEDFNRAIAPAFQLEKQKKSLVLYVTACLILNLGLAWLLILAARVPLLVMHWQPVMIAGFLIAGIVHVLAVSKYLVFSGEKGSVTLFTLSLLVGLLTGLGIVGLLMMVGNALPQVALGAAGAFVLPAMIRVAWTAFNAIAPPVYPTWLLPATQRPKNQLSFFLNSIEISLKLRLNYFDVEETTFPLTVPGSLELGTVFQRFLSEMEEAGVSIQLYDQRGAPFSWLFTMKKFPVNRVLDPAETLTDNGVRKNTILRVERVKVTAPMELLQ